MILGLLMYHMSQDTRQMLMLEAPAAYNDVCNQEVVAVHRTSTGERVIPGVISVTRLAFSSDTPAEGVDNTQPE
jgi:hypothetical protein